MSGGPAPARAYIEELLPDVLAGLDLDTMFMFVLAGANGDRHAVAYLKRKGVTIPQSSSAEVVAAG